MGSGNYPITKSGWPKEFEKLENAKKLIEEVRDSVPADVYQFDNAESDGGYREDLWLAIKLIGWATKD